MSTILEKIAGAMFTVFVVLMVICIMPFFWLAEKVKK